MQANTLDEEIKLSVGLVGWNRTVTILRQQPIAAVQPSARAGSAHGPVDVAGPISAEAPFRNA